jgi:serine protease Do
MQQNKRAISVFILQFAICNLQFAIASADESAPPADLAAREEAALRAAGDKVAPSVVQIRTIGGFDTAEGTLLADGPTTGLVISPDGYIVSSAFNFVQQPTSILVTFATGKQSPAELVATDHSRLLVLLKAPATDLPVPPLAPASETRPGQWAIALGRTFRADRPNVSVGIVSAVNRMFGKAIQTDADISTANYGGPLVDIHGRVLGLLVPMAPQGSSQGPGEVAGVELYDSGIGFAVPLAPLAEHIESMKKGDDQRPGLLGIGMGSKNAHTSPAVLSVIRPDGPAGRAGFRKGDRIVELNGKTIGTQTDLRFALGPLYGGETVKVVATRGKNKERIEHSVTLVGELPAFRHAFLGILPMRPAVDGRTQDQAANEEGEPATKDADKENSRADAKSQTGVAVRAVFPASPAAEAGVTPGDRIVRIDDTDITTISSAIAALNNVATGSDVTLRLIRAGEPVELTVAAGRLPTNILDNLPSAYEPAKVLRPGEPAAAGKSQDLKLAEFPHECRVYVPASHDADRAQAVLLWMRGSSDTKADDIIQRWQSICDLDGIILAVPTAAENARWERTDLVYLRRLLERVVSQFKIDPQRVVVFGQESGGAMAWLAGLASRDIVRGLATSASPLPRQIRLPQNEPTLRLAIFAAIPTNKEAGAPIAQGLEKAVDAGYNVTTTSTMDATGSLSDSQREELARWIDSLDRF